MNGETANAVVDRAELRKRQLSLLSTPRSNSRVLEAPGARAIQYGTPSLQKAFGVSEDAELVTNTEEPVGSDKNRFLLPGRESALLLEACL